MTEDEQQDVVERILADIDNAIGTDKASLEEALGVVEWLIGDLQTRADGLRVDIARQ